MYVSPKYGKKGVGTALFTYALKIASDKFKAKKAHIIVNSYNIIFQ
ncbi:MAG: hypothetical protein DRH15_10715 [Deltaproteobacteria bacterium]|nr:MAG: hypothetical protein DRH15_10715 [Deltaproteobacteria bacterium]